MEEQSKSKQYFDNRLMVNRDIYPTTIEELQNALKKYLCASSISFDTKSVSFKVKIKKTEFRVNYGRGTNHRELHDLINSAVVLAYKEYFNNIKETFPLGQNFTDKEINHLFYLTLVYDGYVIIRL